MEQTDLLEILKSVDPSNLNYQEWVNVGMALKHEGHTVIDWDHWSKNDSRYHPGECEKKWCTFNGIGTPVTGGTIVQLAKNQGWTYSPKDSYELDWNAVITKDEYVILDNAWIEGKEILEPKQWKPIEELIQYLSTLFADDDYVGYVTRSWKNEEGKNLPGKGNYTRTAGELINELKRYNNVGEALGDFNEEAGAWIRFNSLDGKGVKNENVVDFRYALVESDSVDVEKQNAIIRELELPVACLVFSGGKSVHAIVRVDATNYAEYQKRVDYLYNVCNKNGLEIDKQNKNPSRLSRMPGVTRNGNKQFLMDTNIGKSNWDEWKEWIESVNDDLPEPENLDTFWNDMPPLAPTLIDGLLRQGHKMLIAGPSKAGKSFALIEMCIAIAEGRHWFSWKCAQGKILYVNLELDRASCLHRFKDVYKALGWEPKSLPNIDIWNLRGKSIPMDKLAPKLIRRAAKKNYIAIVIDPIYKVITGDENSADQMANFCNQFDKICTELGTAVIYCHHHSKGSQGGKRSMDRASGSGVFARDPDALLDLIELDINENILKNEENKAVCKACCSYIDSINPGWDDDVSQDDLCSSKVMLGHSRELLNNEQFQELMASLVIMKSKIKTMSAWRIEGTLREFPKFMPVNLWFDYPVHNVDKSGVLNDIEPDDNKPSWKGNFAKKKSPKEVKKDKTKAVETAFDGCNLDGKVTVKSIAEYMGVTEKTVRNRLKEHGGFWIDEGNVGKK